MGPQQCISLRGQETHIKICHHQSWANWTKLMIFNIACKVNGEKSTPNWSFLGSPVLLIGKNFRPTFQLANFNMALLSHQINALWWSLIVLGWVQRIQFLGTLQISDRRLVGIIIRENVDDCGRPLSDNCWPVLFVATSRSVRFSNLSEVRRLPGEIYILFHTWHLMKELVFEFNFYFNTCNADCHSLPFENCVSFLINIHQIKAC